MESLNHNECNYEWDCAVGSWTSVNGLDSLDVSLVYGDKCPTEAPIPQNVIVFGNRAFIEVIKLKCVH